jgi:hypothetical protein
MAGEVQEPGTDGSGGQKEGGIPNREIPFFLIFLIFFFFKILL